jgi:hypothetical protein
MSFFALLLRNLLYHGRGNLAVLLGVAVGAAVLTGALLVGDSLRGSLRERSLEQLGWVHHAMVTGRFFAADLADRLGAERAAPAILLRGSVSSVPMGSSEARRVNQVTILAVDDRFWEGDSSGPGAEFWKSDTDGAVLNATLATELGVRAGGEIDLWVQRPSSIPRNALARSDVGDVLEQIQVEVKASARRRSGRFNLSPTAGVARNVFVPLGLIQQRLERAGRANAVLLGDAEAEPGGKLTLDDWGLVVHDAEAGRGCSHGWIATRTAS